MGRLSKLGLLAAGLVFCLPSVALAGGGGGISTDWLIQVLVLLLIVGAAYVLTYVVVGRLQRAFLIVTGVEYVILGVLLGRTDLHAFQDLSGLLPILALATGWIGLLRGVEMTWVEFRDAPRGTFSLALLDNVAGGLVVAGAAYFVLTQGWAGPISPRDAYMCTGFLGCSAATCSTVPLDVITKRYQIVGHTPRVLRGAARAGDMLALFIFGLLFCVFHETGIDGRGAIELSPELWIVVAVSLGLLLGFLFGPFVGVDEDENSRFVAFVGMITFASGAALFLDLSPLFLCLLVGIVLVNRSKKGAEIRASLHRTEKPMTLVLMLFAGALWQPPDPLPTLALLVGFIVLRLAGKWFGARLAAIGGFFRRDLYRGLLAQGDAAIAMAVSLRLVFDGPAFDVAYTVVILSVVFHDLIAPRLLRSLLADSGELRRELEA